MSDMGLPGEDVAEACADALLAASAQAIILQKGLLDPTARVSAEEALDMAIHMLERIYERAYREGAKPR